MIAAEPQLAISKIAYAEVHATVAYRLREGSLTQAVYKRASESFDSEWTAYLRLDLVDPLLSLTLCSRSRASWYSDVTRGS